MFYELLYVIPARYTDTEVAGIQAKVAALLEGAGVKISRHEEAGKLKFAYPMGQDRFGHYFIAHFEAAPEAVAKIEGGLRLSTDISRHNLAKLEREAKGPVKLLSFEEAKARAREARESRLAGPAVAPGRVAPTSVAAPVQEAAVKSTLSDEELNKKLDEILNEQVT
ncbi:30S ribosomal protein S6 [Patescibacteria group bacterium]|nr:MAG: 30S ribosomal protein S6 [Patescibacteria group bacterium]